MPAPESIRQLVARFTDQREDYRSGRYNETQLRRDFLDPFFEALGWDVSNRKNYSEKFREVVHEVSVEVDGAAKAADYAFQTGGHVHFFVEAKKPAVNIETNPEPAFQIRRYGWSAKGVNIGILSDFEQLAIYDCRQKPVHGDPAHVGRANLYSFTEYIDKWDEIAGLLSYDAVHQGSLDKFTDSLKGKRGTADVDDDFLAEMEHWREELARNIALRNNLSQRQINTAVQLIIDRIIFLRICEDRGIEPENGLREATDGVEVYGDLMELFKKADKKYNSGLFHFETEKGQSSHPDTLTPTLKIDDKVFKDILANLYLPKSPYAFNYFSAEILGQVYERFLGKVIRLTAGGHAKVEEKPEVRKAGGVYYTPAYIVEYIVKNTVGELLKDKTPADLAADPIRIVDPACGSGSFLLGAYQYLLDWTLNWYIANDPAKWAKGKNPPIFEGVTHIGGYAQAWQLSMEKKKELLTSHIFGVDIDAQAVEVTKLSLLLKVVENPGQLDLFGERILPDLGDNIKCGNSLIGPDIENYSQSSFFDDEEKYRVNAFDWLTAFPTVFTKGGFDAVIGNPPYIRIQALQEWAPIEVEFYKKQYKAASKGNYDIYVVFVEKGLSLLNRNGKLGFILPHKFFQAQFAKPIREILTKNRNVNQIVHFGSLQVFDNATTYTCLIFLSKKVQEKFRFIKVKNLEDKENLFLAINDAVNHSNYEENEIINEPTGETEWNFSAGNHLKVLEKIKLQPKKISDITKKIFQGIATSSDKIYVLELLNDNGKTVTCFSRSLNKEVEIEKGLIRIFLMGKDVHRYQPLNAKHVVIFPYLQENGKAELMSQSYIRKNFPKGWDFLQANKCELQNRERGRMHGDNYYAYIYPKNLLDFDAVKIITPDIALGCQLAYDEQGVFYHTTTIYSFVFNSDQKELVLYFLGILNSKLFWYFLSSTGNVLRGGYFRFKTEYIRPFPIRTINFSDPVDLARHDRMVALVESMLALHKQSAAARLPDEKERLSRQIEQTDRQIDRLVYELYGLTEEEIKIVEGG